MFLLIKKRMLYTKSNLNSKEKILGTESYKISAVNQCYLAYATCVKNLEKK